jgi:hypothetical protein
MRPGERLSGLRMQGWPTPWAANDEIEPDRAESSQMRPRGAPNTSDTPMGRETTSGIAMPHSGERDRGRTAEAELMPAPQPPGIPPEDLRVAERVFQCPAVRLS